MTTNHSQPAAPDDNRSDGVYLPPARGRYGPRIRTRQQLLAALAGGAPHTVRDLTQQTGLSRGTLIETLQTLSEEGRVEQGEPTHATRGRPASTWRVTTQAGLTGSLILDRRAITATVADSSGEVLGQHRHPVTTCGPGAHVEVATRWMGDLVADHHAGHVLRALAVGVDGFVRGNTEREQGGLHYDHDGVVAAVRAGMPEVGAVVVDTVAQLGAIGEHAFGAARGADSLLYVRVGDSVSGAVILDRVLYRGVDGTAGNIGHHPAVDRGETCRCGGRGCLETITSALYLERELTSTAPTARSSSGIRPASISAEQRQLLVRTGQLIGQRVGHAALTLNPRLVVVSVETPHPGVVRSAIRTAASAVLSTSPLRDAGPIRAARLGVDAPARGGIARAARVLRRRAQHNLAAMQTE